MRRISAHYIFPIAAPPLRNAVITLDDSGMVLNVSGQHRHVQESGGVEFYNGIIAPAFVNAHCHLELSYMRGMVRRGCGMQGFIPRVGHIRSQPMPPARIAYAIKYANALMYQSGVAAVMDVSNDDSSFEVKTTSRIVYRTFIEKYGLLPSQNAMHLADAQLLLRKAHAMELRATISPHAPYSVAPDFMRQLVMAAMPSSMLCIHHMETPSEQDMFEFGTGALAELFKTMGLSLPPANGMHSLAYMAQFVPPSMRLILVHNTYMTQAHYDYAAKRWQDVWYVLCPHSNLYIENALPPVEMLHRCGARITLGTDSFASHPSLMLIDDILLLQRYFPSIPLNEILTWATLNGAQAMRMSDILGSIEVGKRPGLVWIEGMEYVPTLRLLPTAKAQRVL
jgi:cytosine/adenosine deaminase-related metal-dependent hydrolase